MTKSEENWMPCPICQSHGGKLFAKATDIEYRSTLETYHYIECPSCTAIYLDSPPLNQLARIYPTNYYSYSGAKTSLLEKIKQHFDNRLFRKLLAKNHCSSLKVLDIGGGTGWLLNHIRKGVPHIKETHIIDINERARAEAERAGHTFHCTRIEDFSVELKYDLIIILNLIEHVADPAAILRKAKSLLSQDGSIVLKTPNTASLDCRLFRHANWAGFHCPRHWVLFTKRGFTRLIEQTGLTCQRAYFTQGAPFWTFSILAMLERYGLVTSSRQRPLVMHPLAIPILAATALFDFLRLPFFPTSQMIFIVKAKQ